jgi:hypothetical protein
MAEGGAVLAYSSIKGLKASGMAAILAFSAAMSSEAC